MPDLGAQPEPTTEPSEPNPGGVDALPDDGERTTPDPAPADNPAMEEKAPEEVLESVGEGEDTSTSATRNDDDGDGDGDDAIETEPPV